MQIGQVTSDAGRSHSDGSALEEDGLELKKDGAVLEDERLALEDDRPVLEPAAALEVLAGNPASSSRSIGCVAEPPSRGRAAGKSSSPVRSTIGRLPSAMAA